MKNTLKKLFERRNELGRKLGESMEAKNDNLTTELLKEMAILDNEIVKLGGQV